MNQALGGSGGARLAALLAGALALAGCLGCDAAVLLLVVALAGVGVVLSHRVEGHTMIAVAAGLAAVRTGSALAGAGALVAAVTTLFIVGAPSVGPYWRLSTLIVAGSAALFPLSLYTGALLNSPPQTFRGEALLGTPAGRGLLLVLASLYTAMVLWMALAPGRSYPSTRGAVRKAYRRIDVFVAAPLLVLMAVAALVSPLSLVFTLIAAAGYIWSRLMGAGRLGGILVAALIYGGLLIASGMAADVDRLLAGITPP